jgi:hypothetical protein
LPRLRLQAEPIEEQLERLRKATVALTIIVGGIGSVFVILFSAFGAPIVGLTITGLMAGMVIVPAWRSFRRIRTDAERYLQELREEQARRLRLDGSPG